jgi:hypothetical protein
MKQFFILALFESLKQIANNYKQYTVAKNSTYIDKTTRNLIKLATNNPNEHEANSAAIKACERLNQQFVK